MAYDIIPSAEWQEILNIQDEKEQGIAAIRYVTSLENEINKLKKQNKMYIKKAENNVIKNIMRTEPFKEWLFKHDHELIENNSKDWSGLQGGE